MRDVLLAQVADQLNVLPGHAVLLLPLHHSTRIAPPLGSRPPLLGSGLGPEVGIGGPSGVRGELIQQSLQALVLRFYNSRPSISMAKSSDISAICVSECNTSLVSSKQTTYVAIQSCLCVKSRDTGADTC